MVISALQGQAALAARLCWNLFSGSSCLSVFLEPNEGLSWLCSTKPVQVLASSFNSVCVAPVLHLSSFHFRLRKGFKTSPCVNLMPKKKIYISSLISLLNKTSITVCWLIKVSSNRLDMCKFSLVSFLLKVCVLFIKSNTFLLQNLLKKTSRNGKK